MENLPKRYFRDGRMRGVGSPKQSINAWLLYLGAPVKEVYRINGIRGPRNHPLTIYERYSVGELREWAERLYAEAKRKYHPDQYPEEDRWIYEAVFKECGECYEKIKRVLKYKR